jgi:hypothetical protein
MISNSEQMARYRNLAGNSESRPIPLRYLTERGADISEILQLKKMASAFVPHLEPVLRHRLPKSEFLNKTVRKQLKSFAEKTFPRGIWHTKQFRWAIIFLLFFGAGKWAPYSWLLRVVTKFVEPYGQFELRHPFAIRLFIGAVNFLAKSYRRESFTEAASDRSEPANGAKFQVSKRPTDI